MVRIYEGYVLRNTNLFLSCLNLTESYKNMSLRLTRELPCVFACTTTIGEEILERHECAEIFIDSTYNTNTSKFELFAVIPSVLGTGVPIAYIIYSPELKLAGITMLLGGLE